MDKEIIEIDGLGELMIVDALVTVDYPRVFVCEDGVGDKYLFSETDFSDCFIEWLIIRLSTQRYNDLRHGNVSLQFCFRNPEIKDYYLVKELLNENRSELKCFHETPTKLITDAETYFTLGNIGE